MGKIIAALASLKEIISGLKWLWNEARQWYLNQKQKNHDKKVSEYREATDKRDHVKRNDTINKL